MKVLQTNKIKQDCAFEDVVQDGGWNRVEKQGDYEATYVQIEWFREWLNGYYGRDRCIGEYESIRSEWESERVSEWLDQDDQSKWTGGGGWQPMNGRKQQEFEMKLKLRRAIAGEGWNASMRKNGEGPNYFSKRYEKVREEARLLFHNVISTNPDNKKNRSWYHIPHHIPHTTKYHHMLDWYMVYGDIVQRAFSRLSKFLFFRLLFGDCI